MASKTKGDGPKRQGKNLSHNVKISKLLSYILRHGAEKEGLNISAAGFVKVSDILAHPKFANCKFEDIQLVVEKNEKQRFHLCQEDGSDEFLIRANQGHSIDVPELDLVELERDEIPTAIHGTYESCVDKIKKNGLSKMRRQHIHMAVSEPGQQEVISGMRQSCDYIITINIARAQADGLVFYRSSNNVILCEGDKDGVILPKYFDSVKHRI